MSRVAVNAGRRSLGPYADAVWAGGLLLLSGRVGLDGDGLAKGVGAQTSAAIRNSVVVREEAGLSLSDVVRCTVYLADMADFEVVNDVYGQAFDEPRPARTTVAVAGLPLGARVAIEMTALASMGSGR